MSWYETFEQKLTDALLRLCTEEKALEGMLLNTEDLDDKWEKIAPDYVVDMIREYNAYPEVTLAWAAYAGMAFAKLWDEDWLTHSKDSYTSLYGMRGFDDMDEHITSSILGLKLDSPEAAAVSDLLFKCAVRTRDMIRKENIQPQSSEAFHALVHAARAMFRIGAAVELKKLTYHFEKIR